MQILKIFNFKINLIFKKQILRGGGVTTPRILWGGIRFRGTILTKMEMKTSIKAKPVIFYFRPDTYETDPKK